MLYSAGLEHNDFMRPPEYEDLVVRWMILLPGLYYLDHIEILAPFQPCLSFHHPVHIAKSNKFKASVLRSKHYRSILPRDDRNDIVGFD